MANKSKASLTRIFLGLWLFSYNNQFLAAFSVVDAPYHKVEPFDNVHTFPKDDQYVVNYVRTGQGTCQILQCGKSGGKKEAVVLDCGGAEKNSLSDNALTEFLTKLLPAQTSVTLTISHPDADHYNRFSKLPEHATYNSDVYVGGPSNGKNNNNKEIELIYKEALKPIPESPNFIYSNKLTQNKEASEYSVSYFTCGQIPLAIIYANTDEKVSSNAWSLAIYANFGDDGVLFQGDLVRKEQKKAFKRLNGTTINGYLYKEGITNSPEDKKNITIKGHTLYPAAHHGSKLNDSYYKKWYKMFAPNSVEISVGINEGYKHPQQETVEKYISELTKKAVTLHKVSYYGAGDEADNGTTQTIKTKILAISHEYNKNKVMDTNGSIGLVSTSLTECPPPLNEASTPPRQPTLSLQQTAPTPAFNKESFNNPSKESKARMLYKICQIIPLVKEIKDLAADIDWLEAIRKADAVIYNGGVFIARYPDSANGYDMRSYQSSIGGLLSLFNENFDPAGERWHHNKKTDTALYETLSNGSLSYFYSGGELQKLICYQEENEGLQHCNDRLTGRKRGRD